METKKNKSNPEEIPFLDLNDATQDQFDTVFDTVHASLHKTLKAEDDFEIALTLASKTNANDPKEAVSLIRAMQRMMAKQIGYTPRAMQLLCIKHGLRVLRPEELKVVLINKQRMTSQAHAWCREQSKIENKECENAAEE
jgi:hypothetical protein